MQRLWMYLSIRYRMRFTEQAWEIQMFLIILYSATITDKSVQVTEDDWLSVNIQGGTDNSGVIVLDKAFVRTENGAYYVYKEENGVLKKQPLTVGGNANGGNVCNCKKAELPGITIRLQFPYGKTAKEGVKNKDILS